MSDLTSEGVRLVNHYLNSRRVVERERENLARAEREAQEAEVNLATWLLPEDARIGETFAVWHGDSLFAAVRAPMDGRPTVSIRTRGKHHGDLEADAARSQSADTGPPQGVKEE